MVKFHGVPIALLPAGENHLCITGSKDIGAHRRREVHSGMETANVIDGVDTHAVARGGTLEVFVEHRLDGRQVFHTHLLRLGEFQQLIVGLRLDIGLFGEEVDFHREVGCQLRVGHASDGVIVGNASVCPRAHRERNRLRAEQNTVQVLIALFKILHHNLHLVDLTIEHLQLCF